MAVWAWDEEAWCAVSRYSSTFAYLFRILSCIGAQSARALSRGVVDSMFWRAVATRRESVRHVVSTLHGVDLST